MDLFQFDLEEVRGVVGAVLRSKADWPRKSGDLAAIGKVLAELPLELPPPRASIRTVSLVTSANALDPHLSVVIGYVLCLLTVEQVEAVNVVFTTEFSQSGFPTPQVRRRVEGSFRQALARHRELCAAHVEPGDLERVAIFVRPDPAELAGAIGDAVIRFEGAAPHFTTFVAARAIHRQRPVLTATYSSTVQRGQFSELTLVRGEAKGPAQVSFVPALVVPEQGPASLPEAAASGDLLTVYGQNRLRDAMGVLRDGEWNELIRYFQAHPEAKWRMVGAEDPEAVADRMPPFVLEHIRGNVEVHGRSDLAGFFARSAAFLPLPRVAGGALGALQAVCAGCPVVSVIDPDADISNFIPAAMQFPSLGEALRFAGRFRHEPGLRAGLLSEQRSVLESLSDFSAKGGSLFQAIEAAAAAWRARHPPGPA